METKPRPSLVLVHPSKIKLFPLSKRVGKIRHTALKLSERQGDDAKLYWTQVVSSARRSLERLGFPEDQIAEQLETFRRAVWCEVVRMGKWTPGGVA